MITVKIFSKKISAWLGNRESARERFQVSDYELRPIRIRSSNIEDVVRLLVRRGAHRVTAVPDRRPNALTTRQWLQPAGHAGLGSLQYRSQV